MSHLTFEDSENDELCDTARDDRPLLLADVTSVTVQLRTNDKPYKINNLSERIFQYSSNRKGGIFNSRDYRKSHAEKWGRIHWGILSIGIFSIIYFCFTLGAWVDERPAQIVVNIPPVDDSLPSPREYDEIGFQHIVNNFFPLQSKSPTTTKTTKPLTRDVPHPSLETSIPTSIVPTNHTVPAGYLVWSAGCQMPALEPLAKDVMHLFHQEKYESCTTTPSLTSIQMNWTASTATLVVDSNLKWYKNTKDVMCCYQEISRSGKGKHADEQFKLSDCVIFNESMVLPTAVEYILVKCKFNGKTLYSNSHAIIREKEQIRKRLNDYQENKKEIRPLSVLMLSIDSISRLNLIRAMPKTAQHLYDNNWFELQGYNKIDDNTYPNLMAILTGYNSSLAYNFCEPRTPGKLEQCPFVWSDFRKNGYVTAYGEDEASISTFNYHKTGFIKEPTDYYMRPYMLAAEKNLHIKLKHSLKLCLGFKHSVDHIYEYAMDFATQYRDHPSFGLFWTNTFSHNDISDPSSMDQKMKNYLDVLQMRGILKNSMVVFFSDHGLRFGPVRHLVTGWLEERLPFMFIWLPAWFQNAHPEIVQALKINRNRLTNPYDLHMTLKHILELSGRTENMPSAVSCANCQSLFKQMPLNRSCEDVSIESHWCTCSKYKTIDKSDRMVKEAVKFVIEHLNNELKNHTNCAHLSLKAIAYARKAEYHEANEPYDDYMCVFEASPSNGWFESTVRYSIRTDTFGITGSVSRLDMYASQSTCMKFDYLRKYCYCSSKHKNG